MLNNDEQFKSRMKWILKQGKVLYKYQTKAEK